MSLILNSSRSDHQQSSLFHFNEEQSLNDTQESKIPFEWGPSAAITRHHWQSTGSRGYFRGNFFNVAEFQQLNSSDHRYGPIGSNNMRPLALPQGEQFAI